jgi:hypothetical protein
VDVVDQRRWWTSVELINQMLNRSFIALDVRIDAAVRAVPDPARDTELVRPIAHPGAKEDALHPAGHADVPGNPGHHTVEISGASSAFMPTTL